SAHLLDCALFGYTDGATDPTDTPSTESPSTDAPSTDAPSTDTPATTAPITCAASEGDLVVGVQSIIDATCVNGGLGCYNTVCRFCKYRDTEQSSHLVECSSLGYTFTSDGHPTADTPAPVVV